MLLTKELPFITKILIPKNQGHIVRRDRLVSYLKAALSKKVQIICAPAGYGKTALLAEFAYELDHPLCWFSCAPEDHDPTIALSYCLQSVRTTFPHFGAEYRSLFKEGTDDNWHSQIGYFISALYSDVDGPLTFVFDDLHWIHGKKDLEEALSLLVLRSPNNIQFVLASREWPSLSCLPRLSAENQLSILDSGHLRFTVAETNQLLTTLWEREVTEQEAKLINERVGGWAAATFMTARLHVGSPIQQSVKASEQGALFDYLSKEVFDQLPDSVQHFLLRISVLREFTPEYCDRVLGVSRSAELIAQVQERGLFIEGRVGEGNPYKFHDLFREYLYRRLCSEYPEEQQSLHLRAAAIFSDLEDYDAAIFHYLEGGHRSKAVELVKRVAGAYYDQGRWQKLDSWLAQFPAGIIEQEPELLLLSGQVLLRLGEPNGSLDQLDKLISGPHSDNLQTRGKALVAKSTAYRRLGHLDMAVAVAQEGLSILKNIDCSPEDIAEAYKQIGNAYSTRAECERAVQNFRAALALTSKENLRLHSLICNDLGVTYMYSGDLEQAAMCLEEARLGLLKLGSVGPMAEAMVNLALVYYHRGEFGLALDEVSEAVHVAKVAGYPRVVATALMNQAMIQGAFGAHTDSLATATDALKLARDLLDHRLIAESTEDLGTAYRKLGETSKAEVLLKQALLEVEGSDEKYTLAIYHISLGKLYCQSGSYESAMKHLKEAEGQLTELGNLRRVAEIKLFQSAVYYRTNRLRETVESLSEVAELVAQVGYDGFLLADGEEVIDVIRLGAVRQIGDGTFRRLINRLMGRLSREDARGSADSTALDYNALPKIRAFAFGSPRVVFDTHEVSDREWRSRKAKELCFFFLSNKRLLTSEEISDALWPDASGEVSSASVRRNIYLLRQALFFDFVIAKDSGYSIHPDIAFEYDLDVFLQNLNQAVDPENSRADQEAHLKKAIDCYKGPFLHGFYSEWCQELRNELELKFHAALMTLASYYTTRGKFQDAAGLLARVVAADPYNEEAQYQLIECYIDSSQPFAALQQLRRYARLCLEELGVDLPKRMLHCHERIQSLIPRTA